MIVLLIIVVGLLLGFLVFEKRRHSYWQRKGIYCQPPHFLFGNVTQLMTGNTSIAERTVKRYQALKAYNSLHGGMYFFLEPVYIPLDPSLIKRILTKDFQHFEGHGVYYHPKDVLSMSLFNLEGDTWKHLRAKVTPTFTSGKMKMMFETLLEKTQGLQKLVGRYCEKQEPVAIKDVLARFTTDVIGSCAFGIECNSLENPENEFRKYGMKTFAINKLKLLLIGLIPWNVLGNLGFKVSGKDVTRFFSEVVRETIKHRETHQLTRKDFMQLLLEIKNQDNPSQSITEEEIIAQCFGFFLAGFETSSTTMNFALLELAMNPDIQEKLRQEINDAFPGDKPQLTYNEVISLPYLDKVVNETLRKYPAATILPRVCSKTYKVPGTDVVIEKGTRTQILVWAIHMDPQYYPNPAVFDPERFSEEGKSSRPDCTYLPFGEGPRMCIGMRFGLMETKVGLISLLKKFRFSLSKKTPLPIEMSAASIILNVKGEVWLDVAEAT